MSVNLQQAKILIEKISTLHKNISIEGESISPIEKDLMLSYIRQLYETFLYEASAVPAPKQPTAPVVVPAPPTPKATPKPVEVPVPIVEKTPPPPAPIEVPKPIEKPVIIETPKPTPPPEPAPKPEPKHQPIANISNSEADVLFEAEKATELSHKLSETPIADLKKAFSINDRLLYTNELFGMDGALFEACVNALNEAGNFDNAKQIMIANYANRFTWAGESKKKLAKAFIKLVKRRYS